MEAIASARKLMDDVIESVQWFKTQAAKERSFLPINLNGKTIDAVPDTMSSENIITESYARRIGAIMDRRQASRHTFTNACGKPFQSLGETTIEVSFPDDPFKTWKCKFAVLKRCAASLVMGDPFLRMTKTLTKFRYRLRRRHMP